LRLGRYGHRDYYVDFAYSKIHHFPQSAPPSNSINTCELPMNLTSQEAGLICSWLRSNAKKLPSPRTFHPCYNVDSWDLQDLFRAFRRDATESRDKIWTFVVQRFDTGVWPKMKTSDAFWLRERWQMAERYCSQVAGLGVYSPIPSDVAPPKDFQTTAAWLLLDLWDSRLVDVWIRENARAYVSVWDPSLDESMVELEIYLRKLERL